MRQTSTQLIIANGKIKRLTLRILRQTKRWCISCPTIKNTAIPTASLIVVVLPPLFQKGSADKIADRYSTNPTTTSAVATKLWLALSAICLNLLCVVLTAAGWGWVWSWGWALAWSVAAAILTLPWRKIKADSSTHAVNTVSGKVDEAAAIVVWCGIDNWSSSPYQCCMRVSKPTNNRILKPCNTNPKYTVQRLWVRAPSHTNAAPCTAQPILIHLADSASGITKAKNPQPSARLASISSSKLLSNWLLACGSPAMLRRWCLSSHSPKFK